MARTKSKLQAATLGGTSEDVEAAFYEGMRGGDLEKVMSCWADDDDIACIHPGGMRLLGVASIRAAFEAMFANSANIPVSLQQVHRVDALASSVHHVLECLEVTTSEGTVQVYVPATNVYHKTAQGWRMVVHHASPGTTHAAHDMGASTKVLH